MDLLPSNTAHWHLVLNHLPVVGSLVALLLLGRAFLKNTDEAKRLALIASILVALVAIPTYLTGEPAEDFIQGLPEIDGISRHENMAEVALWVAIGVGALALGALIFFRKARTLPRWVVGVILLLALAVCGLMGRTANLGGKIHHPEIRTYGSPEPAAHEVEH
jgi:hypothetical protein